MDEPRGYAAEKGDRGGGATEVSYFGIFEPLGTGPCKNP